MHICLQLNVLRNICITTLPRSIVGEGTTLKGDFSFSYDFHSQNGINIFILTIAEVSFCDKESHSGVRAP